MKVKIYSILDSKVASFGIPFYAMRDEAAIRKFTDAVNDRNPQNDFWKHPEDFALYHIGEFNDLTGVLEPSKMPLNLMTASSVHKPEVYPVQLDLNGIDKAPVQ